jgi:hypothetical protein
MNTISKNDSPSSLTSSRARSTVFGFDIAVNDTGGVNAAERLEQRVRHRRNRGPRTRARPAREWSPSYPFHDQKGVPVVDPFIV